jgi:hypothetical protein
LEQELIRTYYMLLGDLALIQREMQKLGLSVPARVGEASLTASTEHVSQSVTDRPADLEAGAMNARSQGRIAAIALSFRLPRYSSFCCRKMLISVCPAIAFNEHQRKE